MWKKLCLADINPMKAFELSLRRDRTKFCIEKNTSLVGVGRIIIKKKKAISRGN